ncbi:hypothetical protein MtrunA17_Chr1g0172061 [Medicago truncatula]|uniref:Uncharacterized protein n=1 Tax=Medicago truncatula TaxID=3880 RepID=A0A396JRS3_MEDTR|nr:hypothetical protein MtrunA17_Chr1g0172061 [Medicago truncatula]
MFITVPNISSKQKKNKKTVLPNIVHQFLKPILEFIALELKQKIPLLIVIQKTKHKNSEGKFSHCSFQRFQRLEFLQLIESSSLVISHHQ